MALDKEMRALRDILCRTPEWFTLQGFEEAADEVLEVFLCVVDDPEFQEHRPLVPKVKAMLAARRVKNGRQREEQRLIEQSQLNHGSSVGSPAATVHPIHFDDFDGRQFERLVFAYHVRSEKWKSLEWYGQTGSDLGRDIWGIRQKGKRKKESVCIQCANRKSLLAAKAIQDINKVLNSVNGKPDIFRLVCSGPVSARTRDKIRAHSEAKGIPVCEIWSGEEFEERLRSDHESLLRRFVRGEVFPDIANELKRFAQNSGPANDKETLALIARALDRPAFHTPFNSESSLPGFKQAITDTIQVLNTGIWQTREGKEIARIPSRHDVNDPKLKTALENVERQLVQLRSKFDDFVKAGKIRPCGCSTPDCPIYFFSDGVARQMDELRSRVLFSFHQIYPEFSVRVHH